jgi:hypothetical protein
MKSSAKVGRDRAGGGPAAEAERHTPSRGEARFADGRASTAAQRVLARAVVQRARLQINARQYDLHYDESDFSEELRARPEAARERAVRMICRANGLNYEAAGAAIGERLSAANLRALAYGHPIANPSLAKVIAQAKLEQDFALIVPWLRDMYGTDAAPGAAPSSVALALGTTVPEANQVRDVFGLAPVHVKKGNDARRMAIQALRDCFDEIAGRMSVTIIGHIAYNGSANPRDWTCAGLTVEELSESLREAVRAGVHAGSEFWKLNLLSCGSEQFAVELYRSLLAQSCAPRLMTAIRDEIPITPGPARAQQFRYLFAGDKYNELVNAQNILTSVRGVSGDAPPDLYRYVFMRMRQILGPLLTNAVADLVTRYMLPAPSDEADMQALRHH